MSDHPIRQSGGTAPSRRPSPMGPRGTGGPILGVPTERARNARGSMRRLLRYLAPFWSNLLLVLALAILSTTFSIFAPQKIREAINGLQDTWTARQTLNRFAEIQSQAEGKTGAFVLCRQEGNLQERGKTGLEAVRREILALPEIQSLSDPVQEAGTVNRITGLLEKIPSGRDESGERIRISGFASRQELEANLQAIRETGGKVRWSSFVRILVFLAILYAASALFNLLMGLVMSGVAQKTAGQIRREVDRKLARLPLRYYDSHPHGEIMSRITNDVDTISGTLQQSLTQIVTSVISILGFVIMMLVISPLLTLIVMATMPMYAMITTIIARRSQRFFRGQQKHLGSLSGHVEEIYTGYRTVRAFGQEDKAIRDFEEINRNLAEEGWKAQFFSGIIFPLMNFVSNVGFVLISVVGGLWVTAARLRVGDITAFIQYSRSFTWPIVQTATIANVVQSTLACAERVFEILDEPEEAADAEVALLQPARNGAVSFRNVSFRYREEVPLISDLNLDVQPGHTIAIVGPTGAGKTTLVNLLMRFYDIQEGTITIDGTDIRDLPRRELREQFGMVLQDTWLFHGTIRENIAYGRRGATEEDIIQAARAAHADHFIRTLPEGYETILNEEANNISQGQKQLLTIARAILADPVILVLDEATSSVDTRTEALIQKAMANLRRNRTSFVIAHRLSTIRDAERILVMNGGQIIEQGNHQQLLSCQGFYAALYRSQFLGEAENLTESARPMSE